jgi:hypothetical protein
LALREVAKDDLCLPISHWPVDQCRHDLLLPSPAGLALEVVEDLYGDGRGLSTEAIAQLRQTGHQLLNLTHAGDHDRVFLRLSQGNPDYGADQESQTQNQNYYPDGAGLPTLGSFRPL